MIKLLLTFVAGVFVTAVAFVAQPYLSLTPQSEYASEAATQAAAQVSETLAPHMIDLMTGDIETRRSILDTYFFAPKIALARELYPVKEEPLEIDGVYTEVFIPVDGIPAHNTERVLINLHGGAFSIGARTEGRLESIPVAHVAGIKVVSVDYRQGPEHRFPAGSEDVAIVYRYLLKRYQPSNIGIYGCSAGGMLTAQSVAWFDAHDLPQPGAIGIFCAGGGYVLGGDSDVISDSFGSKLDGKNIVYFDGADLNDPLVAPITESKLLSRFPHTLIINSTRDFTLSPALVTHQRLLSAGVESELHVYEGLNHYFFADTELPESRHAFNVISRFFNQHLGGSQTTATAFVQCQ